MSEIYLGKPPAKVEFWLRYHGKVLFYMTNGKIVSFSKKELNNSTTLNCGVSWPGYFEVEPFKSKVTQACGNNSRANLKKIVDFGYGLTSFGQGAIMMCSNLEEVKVDLAKFSYISVQTAYGSKKLGTVGNKKLTLSAKIIYQQSFYQTGYEEVELTTPYELDVRYHAFNEMANLKKVSIPYATALNNSGNNASSFFSNNPNLEVFHAPNIRKVYSGYGGSYGLCMSGNPKLTSLDFPLLETCRKGSNTGKVFSLANLTYFRCGKIPVSTAQSLCKSEWGLPDGCRCVCSDGEFIV